MGFKLPVLILFVLLCPGLLADDITKLIVKLTDKISDSQVIKDREYIPFLEWKKDRGVYDSNVMLNFHGPPDLATFRDSFRIFDNNMFVTTWVTICILEAYEYGGAPKPSGPQIQLALDAINQYRDKNIQYTNSVMSFWPGIYNSTSGTYISTPTNLIKLLDLVGDLPFKVIEDILDVLGFSDISEVIKDLLSLKDTFRSAFQIPSDFDDTFVNLGLGSLLTGLRSDFPDQQNSWMKANTNLSSIFDTLKTYAYRPFSTDPNANTIDPRTYFYLRSFLEAEALTGNDLALVSTWAQNIGETRYSYNKGVVMPFNVNNVDATVSVNVLYGIVSSVLTGVVSPDTLNDPQIQQLCLNTTNMIVFEIKNDLSDRRDLALTYYPSIFEFYWFTARTVFLINQKSKNGPPPHQDITKILNILEPVLKGHVTDVILKEAINTGDNMTYFDDFLGDGDYDKNNHSVVRGEDRIFTTSMAANALLTTWTIYDDATSKLHWKPDVPQSVVSLVKRIINWLVKYTLSGDYKPYNTFFSGSVKGSDDLPFFFPINRLEYLNGTKITDYSHFPSGGPFTLGIQGVIPPVKYDQMIAQKHFGAPTPTKFNGYNYNDDYFPFWSSNAYTYSTTLMALAKFNNLVDPGQ